MLQQIAERRNTNRLNINLKVFEQETGKRLGLTKNIHCGGMKMLTINPFINGELTEVVIELPDDGEMKKLRLTAESCWCAHDTETATYDVGFRFIYPGFEMKSFYETLFDGLGEQSSLV
ncbi:MAG: hypothetical protein ACI9SC_002614 [Gammaproteobacteria bacterium]|jgi:hypothetical protein